MDDGEKVRETKLLLLCSVRELHNDLIKSPEEGRFSGARNDSGEVLISDTALRKHMPSNLKNISNRHKQMCGCKICIISKQLHLTLMLWRKRRIKVIETSDKPRSEQYQIEIETCSHDDLKVEMMSIMCQPCEGESLPKWKCVLGRCNECPKYQIPNEEQEPVPIETPDILFRVYKQALKCSSHHHIGPRLTEYTK